MSDSQVTPPDAQDVIAFLRRLAGGAWSGQGPIMLHAAADDLTRLRAEVARLTAALERLKTYPARLRVACYYGNITVEQIAAEIDVLLQAASLAALRTLLWRCEGCGEYAEPDPATPEGRGHRVTNTDGSPGYCGPVSNAALRTPNETI